MIKQPLSVYVIKHPKCNDGLKMARFIYSEICRSADDLSSIKSSIQVYFTDSKIDEDNRLTIEWDSSDRTAVVIIMDNNIVDQKNVKWVEYLEYLYGIAKDNRNIRLYPVALCERVMSKQVFMNGINNLNFIRLDQHMESSDKGYQYLILTLRHELCRLLFDLESIKDATTSTSQPVKLFLSHAKKDGLSITKKIRDFINEDTAISDFFDKVDIPQGDNFEDKIRESIESSSMLLIIHSDSFAISEWCKMEVLVAKENDIPILSVDCLQIGEERSFPYLGNTKSIRVNDQDPEMAEKVISCALEVILSKKAFEAKVNKVYDVIDVSDCQIQGNTPELLTMDLWRDENKKKVVYPEPPIGKREYSVLNNRYRDISLLTPIMLYSNVSDLNLINKQINISVSECDGGEKRGLTNIHCQAFIMELTRYILSFGGTIAYGGNINKTNINFVTTLQSVLQSYAKDYSNGNLIKNYVASYLVDTLDCDLQVDNQNELDFIKMEDGNTNNIEQSLTEMRRRMATEANYAIIAGGRTSGYKGKFPGVLEELFEYIKAKKPVFIIGAFGGIGKKVADVLEENDRYFGTGQFMCDLRERYFGSVNHDDYEEVISFINALSMNCLNNGLNDKENETLLETSNFSEAIALVLRGMKKVEDGKNKPDNIETKQFITV